MIVFGDCTLDEFIEMCDQRGIIGADRITWINLFKRAAHAVGAKHGTQKEKLRVSAFIQEARSARR